MLAEEDLVDRCARAKHEVTRIYSYALGIPIPKVLDLAWDELEDPLQEVERSFVLWVLQGERNLPSLHGSWVRAMVKLGWSKEHPYVTPFEFLLEPQVRRVEIALSVVLGVAARYGFATLWERS
jgi:hypothetical protein